MAITQIISAYQHASKRLLLLDYDGVLVPIAPTPEQAAPTQATYDILQKLTSDPRNTCVVISGRAHETLEEWLGGLPIALVAEHGLWRKQPKGQWESTVDITTGWKHTIRTIMERYQVTMLGSRIEEKSAGLAFHYRAVTGDGEAAALQLIRELQTPIEELSLSLIHGKKVVEIIPGGITKGVAARYWLDSTDWDFILGAGDDTTDETLFKVMPDSTYSVKVGNPPTAARFSVQTQVEFIDLLNALPA